MLESHLAAALDGHAGLLCGDERADLGREARRAIAAAGLDGLDVLEFPLWPEAVGVYVDARVAGVCREGALEAFAEALRSALAGDSTRHP